MNPTIRKIYYTFLLLFIAAGTSFAQGPQAPATWPECGVAPRKTAPRLR